METIDISDQFKSECEKYLQENHKDIEQSLKEQYLSQTTSKRFLKARDQVVEDAFEMWKDFVEWHIKQRPDLIEYKEMESIISNNLGLIVGVDKANQPLILAQVKYLHLYTHEQIELFCKFALETATRISEKNGQSKFTVIVEIKGIERKHMSKENLDKSKAVLAILQKYYPERLAHLLIINTNWIFKLAFNILKIFIDKHTLEKLKILSSSKDILNYVDKDQLPTHYHGLQQKDPLFSDYGFIYEHKEKYLEFVNVQASNNQNHSHPVQQENQNQKEQEQEQEEVVHQKEVGISKKLEI